MDASDALDRELIIERAEALRGWLAGLDLTNEAGAALDRELAGIIANDPGGYINGQRPLAGLTVDAFVLALDEPGAGAVGRVRGIGPEALAELRGLVSVEAPDAPATPPRRRAKAASSAASASSAPVAERRARPRRAKAAQVAAAADEPAIAAPIEPPAAPADATPAATAGERSEPAEAPIEESVKAPAEAPAEQPAEEPAAVPAPPAGAEPPARRPRGRPRRDARAAPLDDRSVTVVGHPQVEATLAAPDAATFDDETLRQLTQLWPELHPQARRAIVLFAGTLLIEGAYEA